MNIVLVPRAGVNKHNQVLIEGKRAEHIFKVIKPRVGDELRVGVLNEGLGCAKIVALTKHQTTIEIIHLDEHLPKALDITLLLAMPRPNMLRRILQHTTELGIKQIHIFNSQKVEKSFWQSPLLDASNIEKALCLGLEQSRDVIMPKVLLHKQYHDFLSLVPSLACNKQALVAHPYAVNGDEVQACPNSIATPCVIALGPEGGFSAQEVQDFKSVGFRQVHMGERILRVENAVSAVCGRLAAW